MFKELKENSVRICGIKAIDFKGGEFDEKEKRRKVYEKRFLRNFCCICSNHFRRNYPVSKLPCAVVHWCDLV